MTVNAPVQEPTPAPPVFEEPELDESATREPVEDLITEARQRARRRRLAAGAMAAAVAAVAAIAVTSSLGDAGQRRGDGAARDSAAAPASFGVFEPARGRIVYSAGLGLSAIDPADPSSARPLDLPGLSAIDPADPYTAGAVAYLVPAGWSADGTRLALSNEHNGTSHVMDADGELTRVPDGGGCCWFVSGPWLSPDGTAAVEVIGGDRLRINDLDGLHPPRVVELDPPVGDLETGVVPVTAWSADGHRIAYTAYEQVGTDLLPSVFVIDLDTGIARQLVPPGFGNIRQMAWSPDGSQLLVIAGPWRQSTILLPSNPMVSPKKTGLYLVGADGITPADPASDLHPIASGHFVAATWSPDGEQIAAIDFAGWDRRLVLMRADGSASRTLADLPYSDLFTGVAWHPGSVSPR